MKIIGITGPTGAGKGALCIELEKLGYPCIDTDAISKLVVKPGSECLAELRKNFGNEIIDQNGELIRKKLADIAFSDEKKHLLLNFVTHKYITEEVHAKIEFFRSKNFAACVIDAPLLFESRENELCDITVGVIADKKLREKRIIKRDNLEESDAKKRMLAQKEDSFYIEKCDYIVYNNDSKEVFSDFAEKLHELIKNDCK